MAQVPIDELLKRCNSIYKLVVIAAKRAKELSEGSPKLIEADLKKITSIALEEIRQGKVLYKSQEPEGAEGERPAAGGAGKAKKRAAKGEPAERAAAKKKKSSLE